MPTPSDLAAFAECQTPEQIGAFVASYLAGGVTRDRCLALSRLMTAKVQEFPSPPPVFFGDGLVGEAVLNRRPLMRVLIV